MLHLGRGHEVVTGLDALVRRFSERERLAAQLMRALYGSGRQPPEPVVAWAAGEIVDALWQTLLHYI
jgi:hypothetical protein